MPQNTSIDLSTAKTDGTVFWSLGNRPTQRLGSYTQETVLLHLKALYLLSERVVGAASFFFESMVTRSVTQGLSELFHTGELAYFVDETIEDFVEHGSRKVEKSPSTLTCYSDPEFVRRCGTELNGLEYIVRRPPFSLSDRIVTLWINDLGSRAQNSLGEALGLIEQDEVRRVQVLAKLIQVGQARGYQDFVWEYVHPQLVRLGMPAWFCRRARHRLARMYSIATSEGLGIALDMSASRLDGDEITESSKFDSGIFLSCLNALGATDALRQIPPAELIRLKASTELRVFRAFYFSLLDTVGKTPGTLSTWLPLYRRMTLEFYASGRTVDEFLTGFEALCKSLKAQVPTYRTPLEVLLRLCDLTGQLTIEDFLEALGRASDEHGGTAGMVVRKDSLIPRCVSTVVIKSLKTEVIAMGDVFSNISNSTIINRSLVERSFDKLSHANDDETASALVTVANEISRANNREAGEAFSAFNEELQKEAPRKPVLASLWSGVIAALPAITQLTSVVEKITKMFS
jgi:hypothetical protein